MKSYLDDDLLHSRKTLEISLNDDGHDELSYTYFPCLPSTHHIVKNVLDTHGVVLIKNKFKV